MLSSDRLCCSWLCIGRGREGVIFRAQCTTLATESSIVASSSFNTSSITQQYPRNILLTNVESTGLLPPPPPSKPPSSICSNICYYRCNQIQLLQHEVAQAAEEPNFVSAICRALEGGARDRSEQPHGRHGGRGGVQGQQGPHRITEEFLAGKNINSDRHKPEAI